MFKTYSSSSSLVITSCWFATSRLVAPVSVRLVYWQYCSIGSDNGLAPNRRQAIIWTNDDPVQRHIYASLGLNELSNSHSIDSSHKSHKAPDLYPTMHHFVAEMCTCAHFCYKMVHCGLFGGCIVGSLRWVYWRSGTRRCNTKSTGTRYWSEWQRLYGNDRVWV